MEVQKYISIHQLCTTYDVEITFFNELKEVGLIEIITIAEKQCIHQENLSDLEKMIRMYHDLEVNIQGIDVVFNLLQKVDELQEKLIDTQNRLRIYEND
ncbi:MAG: chaperone modulator CbpM [Fluviicola sp.]|nr:chaperone modulator CbpM [Fluviicola sp.]